MAGGGEVLSVYLCGVLIVVYGTWRALQSEPTTQGQDGLALMLMGCIAAVLWPFVAAYLVIASPWIAFQWWQSRGER